MRLPRPTLRTLAAVAGVSPMTVSLALRNSREVSAQTRARIQELAKRQGYRPDPTIAKLMHHLRVRQPARFQASLCGLMDRGPEGWADSSRYLQRLLTGLRQRADELGYAFDLVVTDDYPQTGRLQRVLLSRGLEGLVILPLSQPRDLSSLLDWNRFATVSVTSSLLAPRFHSITPRHFDNLMLACRQLTESGFRRLGLVLPRDWDRRVNHRWTGAMTWQNHYGGTSPVTPFISSAEGPAIDPAALLHWLRQERPDVLISDSVGQAGLHEAVADLPARWQPQLVTMNWPTAQADAGIDQRVEEIGSTAVDLLAAMLTHGLKGRPDTPHTTMIEGRWVPGKLESRSRIGRRRARGRPVCSP